LNRCATEYVAFPHERARKLIIIHINTLYQTGNKAFPTCCGVKTDTSPLAQFLSLTVK